MSDAPKTAHCFFMGIAIIHIAEKRFQAAVGNTIIYIVYISGYINEQNTEEQNSKETNRLSTKILLT